MYILCNSNYKVNTPCLVIPFVSLLCSIISEERERFVEYDRRIRSLFRRIPPSKLNLSFAFVILPERHLLLSVRSLCIVVARVVAHSCFQINKKTDGAMRFGRAIYVM